MSNEFAYNYQDDPCDDITLMCGNWELWLTYIKQSD
jgi:hypothetical protein